VKRDESVLQKCRAALQALYQERCRGVVLYGSSARGTDSAESDIDLLVLLKGPVDAAREIRRIWRALYPIQLESERLLSVLPVDVERYDQGAYALYRDAKEEGVLL
jgi:predicted nucleotidyltransferase